MHERERAGQRAVARGLVDEAGHDDVRARGYVDQPLAQQHEPEIAGVSVLVCDEELDELRGALRRIDTTDVQEVGIGPQSEALTERVGVTGPVRLHADADDLARR